MLTKKFGRKYSRSGIAGDLAQIGLQLVLARAPGEVGVGLGEAELGERLHDFRPGESLRQERSRRDRPTGPRGSATPRTETAWCAGCRRERCAHPARPRTAPRRAAPSKAARVSAPVEVRIDDIFVFLRRVFRVLDRAVGPALEPFRMLREPGMVGRALDGEVERDLHPVVGAGFDQAPEIVERAKLGMHRVMSALRPSRWHRDCRDRPARRAARCCGPCGWSCRSDGWAGDRARRTPARRYRAGD